MKKLVLFGVLVFLCGMVFPRTSMAKVVFQDNFDSQSDWVPAPGSACNQNGPCPGMPEGWTFYRSMGLWNPPEGNSTIMINGDHHHGPTGKAFTVWNESNAGGSGDGWGADGILAKTLDQDYPELYIQFWIKVQPQWPWPGDSNGQVKVFRAMHYDRSGDFFTFFSNGNSAPYYIEDFENSLNYGGYRQSHSFRCAPQQDYYYCGGDSSADPHWTELPWSGGPDRSIAEPGEIGDGNWHRWVIHLKINTKTGSTWNNDGVIQFWQDGVLEYSRTDMHWMMGGDTPLGWNSVAIGGNAFGAWLSDSYKAERWYSIDDVVASTTPIPADYVIGGSSSGSDTSGTTGTTTVAPPSDLQIIQQK